MIGKSQAVLAGVVVLLRDRGYTADSTSRFEGVTDQFDVRHVDLVVFGGQVLEHEREEIKREIAGLNDHVIFEQGLAGIPGLIVRQVEGTFAGTHPYPETAPSYDANERTINLSLGHSRAVTVIAWWQTSFIPPDPQSDSLVLLDQQLAAGSHSIPLPELVPSEAAFATVQIGAAIYAFSVAQDPALRVTSEDAVGV